MIRGYLVLGVGLLLSACGGDDGAVAGGGGGGAPTGGSSGAGGGGGQGWSGSANGGSSGSAEGGTSGTTGGGSSGSAAGGSSGSGQGGSSGSGTGTGLAAKYPGDVGIENDPAVVWVEDFEQGSVAAVVARYNDAKQAGMALVPDVPPKSSGAASMKLTASGTGPNASDFYKKLDTGYDELFVRWYAKYQSGVEWHHTGVWVGGYNPATNWPNPQAGSRPNGDDRFSVSLEPVGKGANPRMDFYNYWMKMHSWMDSPSGSSAYYGNTLIHDTSFRVDDNQWMCLEFQITLNPGASSGAGAELAAWKNDQLIAHFTDQAPLGYWVKDKFCPQTADGTECTNYAPPAGTTMIPLDLQFRNTTALKLNAFWPQNYITSGGAGSVWYDDMVLATERVGCLN
jgi:hypothetical protein